MIRFVCFCLAWLSIPTLVGVAAEVETVDPDRPSAAFWVSQLASHDRAVAAQAVVTLRETAGTPYDLLQFTNEIVSTAEAEQHQFIQSLKPFARQLLSILESGPEECRQVAVDILAQIGVEAAFARPTILKIARSHEESPDLRIQAACALFLVTPADQPIGPDLVALAKAAGAFDRVSETGPPSEESDADLTTPKLTIARFTNLESQAGSLSFYLQLFLATSNRALLELPTLMELTQENYPVVIRLAMLQTLAGLGPEVDGALPALRLLLADKDVVIQWAAAMAIAYIQDDPSQLPELVRQTGIEEQLPSEIVLRLKNLAEPDLDETPPWLTSEFQQELSLDSDEIGLRTLLYNDNPYWQRYAIRRVARLNARGKPFLNVLRKLATQGDRMTRHTAVSAIERIDPGVRKP
jgi:hypothetical protein